MKEAYLILAEIEINIGDEYYRSANNLLVKVVEATSPEEAVSLSPLNINDDFPGICGGRIEYIFAVSVSESLKRNF